MVASGHRSPAGEKPPPSHPRRSSRRKRAKSETPKAAWEKVLWRKQPYADNYSGGKERFLAELRSNVSAVFYTMEEGVRGGVHLLTHLDIIVLHLLLFEAIQDGSLPWEILSAISIVAILFFYIMYIKVLRDPMCGPVDLWDHFCTILSITAFGYAMIPIFRTLTTTISTDSIYAMAIMAALIACAAHDYGIPTPVECYPVSLSSGLSSAVLLISRLEGNNPAFVYLSISFLLHAHIALIRNTVNKLYPNLMFVLCGAAASTAVALLWNISGALAICWLLFHGFVAVVCPKYLMFLQRYKRTIHGPWDEAVLRRRA